MVKTISIKESVFSANDIIAHETREKLKAQGTLFLNVMSGPGSGKTSTLIGLINLLKSELKIGEMDVDIETDFDATRVALATGVESLQINNCGLCHIDADMTAKALAEYKTDGLDLLILENIGNLVCPAEFDTGAHKNIMLLSVPEGDDKPLKYPLMFSQCDLVLINKIDTLEYFDFDIELAKERIRKLNEKTGVIPISAKTGEGLDIVASWIKNELKNLRTY